ncbi:hypothetical protein Unana1_06366 [Umbelopsis nana]
MTVASVYNDVQTPFHTPIVPKRRMTESEFNVTPELGATKADSVSIQPPTDQLMYQKRLNSTCTAMTEQPDRIKQEKEREHPINERDNAASLYQLVSPSPVPEEPCQEIAPENAVKEKEEEPASVDTTPLLTNTPTFRTVSSANSKTSSQIPSPCVSTGLLDTTSMTLRHFEEPPAITREGRSPSPSHKLHKRSESNASLALSISSQKSLSRMGSKVKQVFSKLHGHDGIVFPDGDFIAQDPESPPSGRANKPSVAKGLNKFMKRH